MDRKVQFNKSISDALVTSYIYLSCFTSALQENDSKQTEHQTSESKTCTQNKSCLHHLQVVLLYSCAPSIIFIIFTNRVNPSVAGLLVVVCSVILLCKLGEFIVKYHRTVYMLM